MECATTNVNANLQNNVITAGGNVNILTVAGGTGGPPNIADETNKLTDWLSPVNYKPRQIDIFDRVTTGTGHWFLESKEYKMLLQNKSVALCGTGIPGAGKTFLSSIVIDDLKTRYGNKSKIAVLFIYCRYSEMHSVSQMLGALLRQLAENNRHAEKYIQRHFNLVHTRDRTTPSEVDFARMVKEVLATLKRAFIVVDALDELQEETRHGLLKHLAGAQASLLLTSRPSEALKRIPSVNMFQIRAPKEDFRRYILKSIDDHHTLSRLLHNQDELRESIIETIIEKANGMYMLASLHLNHLKSEGISTTRALKIATENLPTNLDDMYTETLERVWHQAPEKSALAKRIFTWVLYHEEISFTRIPIDELRDAAALDVEMTSLPMDDEKPTEEDIIACVCGLIRVERIESQHEYKLVSLTHYTTKEFFERQPNQLFGNPHEYLSLICIRYLKLSRILECRDLDEWDDLMYGSPTSFLRLALEYWHRYALKCQESDKIPSAVQEFIRETPSYPIPPKYSFSSGRDIELLAPIHVASRYGFVELTKELLPTANQRTNLGNTALHHACMTFEGLIRLLLGCQTVDVNARNDKNETALLVACKEVHPSPTIVSLLLSCERIDVNLGDGSTTPLLEIFGRIGFRARYHGISSDNARYCEWKECLKLLLQRPEIDLTSARPNVLHRAIERGAFDAVSLLLDRGVDPEERNLEGRTALEEAIVISLDYAPGWPGRGGRACAKSMAEILRAHDTRSHSRPGPMLLAPIIGRNFRNTYLYLRFILYFKYKHKYEQYKYKYKYKL